MASDTRTETPREEALIRETRLRVGLVEVFAGDREGTPEEKEELRRLRAELGDRFYPETVYALLHKTVADAAEARRLFERILAHKKKLEGLLHRRVSVQAAALDYLRAAGQVLRQPTIVEDEEMREIARLFAEEKGTRIFDRDLLLLDVEKELERTKRYGAHFALLLVDLDDLARINQAYGRLTGDRAIQRVSEVLRNNTRLVDSVYRYAEDEFAVLLPNGDSDTAVTVAEKLLKAVRHASITPPVSKSVELRVTASIGAASFSGQTARDAEEVMDIADKLLGEAKRAGKDRIKLLRENIPGGVIEEVGEKPSEGRARGRFVIRGTPISRGVAYGKAFIHKDILLEELKYYEIKEDQIEKELERVRSAFRFVKSDIEKTEKQLRLNLGAEYADIFKVHKTILNDVYLLTEMEEKLRREKTNAEQVVRSVFRRFENIFMTSGNEVTREKSSDIEDLTRRVLRHLAGVERNIFRNLPRDRVVVAKRLLPSESVHLRHGNVRAIVTEKGSKNSHAAILARGLGIPYVSEIDSPIEEIRQDDLLVVDAGKGEVVVNPAQQELAEVDALSELQRRQNTELVRRYRDLALTKDGFTCRVMANVNSAYNMKEALEYGADGIGLFRVEQIYMQSRIFPTQEQLYRVLDDLFAGAEGMDIVIRLLDIGGDKMLPYITMKEELYSFMGLRGVRVLLRYPRLLETQLLAFLRLSAKYRIKILVPLVTLSEEVEAVRGHLEAAKKTLAKSGVPFNRDVPLGAMVEVPAAVVRIEDILGHVDFVSIGTNDLIQYTMASGREIAALARYYEAGTDVVLGFIAQTVRASRERGIECDLCGELAADTNYTEKLMSLGLVNFSVSPANIPRLKSRIAQILDIGSTAR